MSSPSAMYIQSLSFDPTPFNSSCFFGKNAAQSLFSQPLQEGMLLGMGNPLLDISATVKPELLAKHNLKSNDAILTPARE